MRKISFTLVILLTLIMLMGVSSADQTVKTIEIPFGYVQQTTANNIYEGYVKINSPDGITDIISYTVYVKGDFTELTKVYLMVNDNFCNPSYWTAPSQYDYTVIFDCTQNIKSSKNGVYSVKFMTDKPVYNIFAYAKVTYLNKPRINVKLKGTEYEANNYGKVFLQLLDSYNKPINNASCFVSIYYPDNTIWKEHQTMISIGDDGLYYYDFITPYIAGVFMASAHCYIPKINETETVATDDFECSDFYCGTGWLSNWSISSSNDVYIIEEASPYHSIARLEKISWMNRTAINIPNDTVYLIIQFNVRASDWEGGEYANFVYCDANNNCTTLQTWVDGNDDNLFHSFSFTLDNNTYNISYNPTLKFEFYGGTNDFFDVDNVEIIAYRTFQLEEYQEVKGSGEIHIHRENTGQTLVRLGDLEYDNTYFNGTIYPYKEGVLKQNITVYSQSIYNNIPDTFQFETPYKVDCTAIEEFQKWNGTDWVDAYDDIVNQEKGSEIENCKVTVVINISSNQIYQYRILYDNFQKWEVDWSYDILYDIYHSQIKPICDYYGEVYNYTYKIPITLNDTKPSEYILNLCLTAYDDFYWAESYYNESVNCDAQTLQQYLIELHFYRRAINMMRSAIFDYWNNDTMHGLNVSISISNEKFEDLNNTIKQKAQEIMDLINSVNTTLYNKIYNSNQSIHTKLNEINNTLYNEMNNINQSLTDTINNMSNSINTNINNINNTLYNLIIDTNTSIIDKINAINNSIFNKLFSIQDDLENINNNITELYNTMISINSSLSNKLENISGKIDEIEYKLHYINDTLYEMYDNITNLIHEHNESIHNDIINMTNYLAQQLANVTNITLNVTLTQQEMLDTMIGLWGDSIAQKPIQFSLTGLFAGSTDNTYYYCKDNETLVSSKIITLQIGNTTKTYVRNIESKCQYGCSHGQCKPSPNKVYFDLLILAIIILIFFIFIARYMRWI